MQDYGIWYILCLFIVLKMLAQAFTKNLPLFNIARKAGGMKEHPFQISRCRELEADNFQREATSSGRLYSVMLNMFMFNLQTKIQPTSQDILIAYAIC